MYICVTEIDSITGILCTVEPMRNGPSLPKITNFNLEFIKSSEFPITTSLEGTYSKFPEYYGTCSDDADTTLVGVLKVLSEEEFSTAKELEHQNRKPAFSWVGDLATMSWQPPVPYPQDGNFYQWDEPTVSWVLVTQQ
jgi:hypothetical protein